MNFSRRLWSLLAIALLAAGCGGSSGDDAVETADSGSTTSAPVSSTTAAAETTTTLDSSPVIATVNDDVLTESALAAFAGVLGAPEGDALDLWLLTVGIKQDLADAGRPLTDLDLAESELLLIGTIEAPDPLLIEANAVFNVARTLAEEEVAESIDTLEAPEVLCSSHILLDTEAEAADVAALAQAGDDFAELAMTYSTGPSGPGGGDLGCALTAGFVPEFGDGARENGVGVTGPVESQFGWHVIQVRSIGPGTLENHPEMSPETAGQIRDQLLDTEIGVLLDELSIAASERIGAEAEIDAAYGVWDVALGALVGG